MLIAVKPGVNIDRLRAPMIKAWDLYSLLYGWVGGTPCITKGVSTNNEDGLFYNGFAMELRIREIERDKQEELFRLLKRVLSPDFSVALYTWHIEIQYIRFGQDIRRASMDKTIDVIEGKM